MALVGWARAQGRTYFRNGATTRDVRVQLRGAKATWFWFCYIGVLVLFGIGTYSDLQGNANRDLEMLQRGLTHYFDGLSTFLGWAVAIVSTALGASSIVLEKQRRSIDLIRSAPVTPKYYLVGKLLGVQRLVLLMLVMAMPMMSVGVVMGGADWMDVLRTFWVLLLDGLVFSAIGIAVSASCEKLATAVIFAFIGCAPVAAVGTGVFAMVTSEPLPQLNVLAQTLAPFSLFGFYNTRQASAIPVPIGPYLIPCWLLFTPIAVAFVWLMMVAGGSGLSSKPTRETMRTRVAWLAALLAAGWLLSSLFLAPYERSYLLGISQSPMDPSSSPFKDTARLFAGLSAILALIVPYIACYTQEGPRKFILDGPFRIRTMLSGWSSGSGYYTLAMPFAALAGIGLAALRYPHGAAYLLRQDAALFSFACYLAWTCGFLLLVWTASILGSVFASRLTSARGLAIGILCVVLLPVSVFAGLMAGPYDSSPWVVAELLAPIFERRDSLALGQGVAMLSLSAVLWAIARRRARLRDAGRRI